MSCISNNFSSFFLDSLNDPSEFAKYLGNAENKIHTVDEYYGGSNGSNVAPQTATTINGGGVSMCYSNGNSSIGGSSGIGNISVGCDGEPVPGVYGHENHHHQNNHSTTLGITQSHHHQFNQLQQVQQQQQHQQQQQQQTSQNHHNYHPHSHHQQQQQQQPHNQHQQHQQHHQHQHHHHHQQQQQLESNSTTQFDGSFEFSKFLRHSEYGDTTTPPINNLIDLDNSTPPIRSNNSTVDLDNTNYNDLNDDSKQHTNTNINNNNNNNNHIFDVHNSNESSTGTGISSSLGGSGSCDQKTSSSCNTSECSDNSNQANSNNNNNNNNNTNNNNNNNNNSTNNQQTSKPLSKFVIKENYDVHPAHKVEEGIFQHMNKLPNKKKETLKQLGVTFTGHMSISEKMIIVDNFQRFCEEYGINDHRPFLTLNQSGMAKSEQIKFARYLGQGLPNFTLFCIYSNFKNLFCTKRFENYIKGSYNLHYILDKTKRFLTCTTSDLKNLTPQQISEGLVDNNTTPNNNGLSKTDRNLSNSLSNINCRLLALENLVIFENFNVHPSHRIEDGIFTHMSRLSPKKQELLKQFGIQSNHNVSYQEKHVIIENFMKFCNEYYINDHRPFLDFHESGLPKMEQIKFARYLGQGLPNLTLYKIYSAFKDLLALNRIDKLISDGYNLELILKKKKKNLLNRISAIACKERQERAAQERAAQAAAAAAATAAAQLTTVPSQPPVPTSGPISAAAVQAQSMQPHVKLERITS